MSERRHMRAKELAPSILITLLSIIQALSLEVLWSGLHDRPHLWDGGLTAWVGWLQVVAVVGGIALVWVFYTTIVMRFVWLPNIRDSVIPFALGLGEFVLADLLDPRWLWVWFLVLAAVFAYSTWASWMMLCAAGAEPANRSFFDRNPIRPRDALFPELYFVAVLGAFGAVAYVWGAAHWSALACMVVTNVLLVIQLDQLRRYWNHTMFTPEPLPEETP